jgi:cyclophilin family peptidyl-prolyl cis-trans isomerase
MQFLKKLWKRCATCDSSGPVFSQMQPLESRWLLAAPHITSIYADNRGWVSLRSDAALDRTTLTTSNIGLFTAGADKTFGTADDVKKTITIAYSSTSRIITLKVSGTWAANTKYRVRLLGSKIKGSTGTLLDGEFKGATTASGNGTPGGNYDVITKTPSTWVARFNTTAGTLNVKLFANTPLTNKNFMRYANRGAWDVTFFHRLVPQFVVQGGGFKITPTNNVEAIAPDPPVTNEPGYHNLRGTIAMARVDDGDPNTHADENSATNQWFFNLVDNSQNLDNQNGGFTAFGKVTDSAGLAVMDKLGAYDRVNVDGNVFSDVPVKNLATVQSRGYVDPKLDLIKVTRVAMLLTVAATPVAARAVAPAVVMPAALPAPRMPMPAADALLDSPDRLAM